MISTLGRLGRSALRESGLRSVHAAGLDAILVIVCRSTRMFAYGASSLILALFFAELGVPDERIGLFMTLTLAGDVALSLLLTLVADRAGRRRTLRAGALLMVASGTAFALCDDFWVLLAAAVVGVISATGSDFGPFRAVEQSVLAELTGPDTRADVLVWYVTVSTLGSAAGMAFSGRLVEFLRAREGWTLLDAYHACFWLYAVMGGVNLACNLALSERCELKEELKKKKKKDLGVVPQQQQAGDSEVGEADPLLRNQEVSGRSDPGPERAEEDGGEPDRNTTTTPTRNSWVAHISRETLSVVGVLWFLLMVESLADGMSSMSLTTYYMDQKFHGQLPKSALGDVLSAGYLLASGASVLAGPLARRIGLVGTMVSTHVPSSAAVLLFPLAQSVPATFALLLVRVGLNPMDQAPRTALIAAVVRPEERTAVMGITGMLRTLASTTGPSITGVLAGRGLFWVAFVVAGALRLAYDVGVFALFINVQLHRHEREQDEHEHEHEHESPAEAGRSADRGRGDANAEV